MTDAAPVVAHLIESGTRVAHPLVTAVVHLGRDPACDVLLRDATVSRRHAEVHTTSGYRVLTVTGSTGARVNDARVTAPMTLAHGDRIEIGIRSYIYHEGELPAGINSYVGHGQDTQQDPLLLRTTQSNPVVVPEDVPGLFGRSASDGADWTTIAIVVAAFAIGFWFYARSPR